MAHSFRCISPRNRALTHKQCAGGGRHLHLFSQAHEGAVGTQLGWPPKDIHIVSGSCVQHTQDYARVPGIISHQRIKDPSRLWYRKPMPSRSARPSPRSCICIRSCEPRKSAPAWSDPGRPPPPSRHAPLPGRIDTHVGGIWKISVSMATAENQNTGEFRGV